MKTVNIHEAKTNLSKLIEAAVHGEPFVIAKAGKPVVKVTLLEQETPRRIGFMEGAYTIPEDFSHMGDDTIQAMFNGV